MSQTTRKEANGGATETINFRASREQKNLFDRAAVRMGKTRTEFLLDSAREAAENTLLDQRLFITDTEVFDRFLSRLDEPVEPADALKKLLSTSSPWE